jgi:DNA-binding transcriptional ArsR family regulator
MDFEKLADWQIPTRPVPTVVEGVRKARKVRGEYLRGPIPLSWLTRACELGGSSVKVALAVWFAKGVQGGDVVRLTSPLLVRFGVSPKAKLSGLNALEESGLIAVERRVGRNPLVTILEVE